MGASENHGPHPKAQDPPLSFGEIPALVDHFGKHLPDTPTAGVGVGSEQVDKPSTYEITGKVLLAASGAFAGILLALIVLHMCNGGGRLCRRSSSSNSSGRQRRRLVRSLAITGDGDDRDGGAAPSPRGLDPAVHRALPVVIAAAGGDCVVCLAEFEAGEKARALPRCGHRFHVECIDAWFRDNSTCPLCRADVETPSAAGDAQPEVRIDITGDAAAAAAAAKGGAPAMGRLASGTDLEKTRRVFASTRSASF